MALAIILLIIGLVAGFATGYFYSSTIKAGNAPDLTPIKTMEVQLIEAQGRESDLRVRNSNLENEIKKISGEYLALVGEKSILEGRIQNSIEQFKKMETQLREEQVSNKMLSSENASLREKEIFFHQKLTEQKAELENIQKKFTSEFENIANKILEEKSQKFTDQNKSNLDQILKPLGEKIKDFEDKVQKNYDEENKDKASLRKEIQMLYDLNQRMSQETQNLTKALKGDNKQQGNWGELILEKILENSGLLKGQEYETQFSTTNDEGRKIQPDVIIKLPDNKHIILDSKVSLTAYNEWINEQDEMRREIHLKNHIVSFKSHIKILGEKNYQQANGLNAPEFVLMFIPLESSFSAAIQYDNELWTYAWDKKIVIVSPSTLLATLRTIASVWKQERQSQNHMEIARQAGAMYDKFVGFLTDLDKIDKSILQAKNAYDDAMNKIKDGSGNLIRRAENIKTLGAKTTKDIPEKFLE